MWYKVLRNKKSVVSTWAAIGWDAREGSQAEGEWSLPVKNDDGHWSPGEWMPALESGYRLVDARGLIGWPADAQVFEVEASDAPTPLTDYTGQVVGYTAKRVRLTRQVETYTPECQARWAWHFWYHAINQVALAERDVIGAEGSLGLKKAQKFLGWAKEAAKAAKGADSGRFARRAADNAIGAVTWAGASGADDRAATAAQAVANAYAAHDETAKGHASLAMACADRAYVHAETAFAAAEAAWQADYIGQELKIGVWGE